MSVQSRAEATYRDLRTDPEVSHASAMITALQLQANTGATQAELDVMADHLMSLTDPARRWYAGQLPTFEEIRARAYGEIGDVLDTLRSDWLPGHGPTGTQADALADARELLAQAKTALNRAAR
jgi:hypothetical protein